MKHEMKAKKFKVGGRVKVVKIPPGLTDPAGIDTPGVFKRALGKTFRIEGFGKYGHLRLKVGNLNTIWIEPEFVVLVERKRKSRRQ